VPDASDPRLKGEDDDENKGEDDDENNGEDDDKNNGETADGAVTLMPSRANGAVVSLWQLKKDFGQVGAVRNVSLEIGAGEFMTLLGPSGSGKSTTLMMIAGFETPTGGDIAIDGQSVIGVSPHRRDIGMVFQNYALFPHLTVAANIGFPLKQRGIARAERDRMIKDALDLVRLPGYGDRYPRQLSGGQQQRVALARAIVFNPRLLLMDEPLGALDKQLRESLQLEMRRLHADLGITFIYVTHDQEEALTMSDRIAVMNEGHIAQLGRPEDLYDRPCSRFVASFLGESNFLPGIVHGFQDGGIVVADCAGIMLRAVTPTEDGPGVGQPVLLTMRPERMKFANGIDSPTCNRMHARVTEAIFAGERCRYLLAAPDGTAMVLKEPSGAAVRRRAVGEIAEITWSAADTVVV
jgi:spermidine/putrescine ABC transporter ATP-binding subunit